MSAITRTGLKATARKGRSIRAACCGLRIRDNKIEKTTVVAHSLSHPNGVRIYKDHIYVTVSMLPKVKRSDGLCVSAVYRFKLDDENVAMTNTLADKNLLLKLVTNNADCKYGADGIVFDNKGNLFVGNFGDGAIHKIVLDKDGKVASNTVFARTDFNTRASAKDFREKMVKAKMRTTDGICVDEKDNLYVADFSNNAVNKVDRQGHITVLAQSPDCDGSDGGLNQPGEPIVWNGKLVISCFDAVTGPNKVNTKHDKTHTLAYLELQP